MTYIELLKRVDSLAPLPKTLLEIEEFKKSDNYDISDLAKIVEQDPLMVSTILKTANSAMFGFVSKIDTLSRAINLLGVNFTISIALGSGVKRALNSDLDGYGLPSDEFLRIANMQSNFINIWVGRIDTALKDELILPAFLQESGKFLISDAVKEEKKQSDFIPAVNSKYEDLSSVEKEFVGMTCAEVTSAIFKHWNLTQNIINCIKYSDDPSKASPMFKKQSQILHISKIICNIIKPFDDKVVQIALAKAKEFGFEEKPLLLAIEKMQDRLLEEK